MNGNKHINKLATQIGKKQDNINGWICSEIEVAKKNLQFLLDTKAKEEKEIEELKTQQEALKNHKTGRLAKVSLYEFVNDWVRPEISFKIFSYLADPHKEGINKARNHRRRYQPAQQWAHNRRSKAVWTERKFYPEYRHQYRNNETPYCELPLYKEVSSPYFKENPADERAHYTKMSIWVKQYEEGYTGDGDYGRWGITHAKLRNTNPLLLQLWKFHQTQYTANGNKKFVITKGYIKKYLSTYKVKGRTDLTYGVKCVEARGTDELWRYIGNTNVWLAPLARQELVGALMKL